ncbi:hypothetical protein PFISCL1PPCAC_11085, partial [Pristionchus fissidentatus]
GRLRRQRQHVIGSRDGTLHPQDSLPRPNLPPERKSRMHTCEQKTWLPQRTGLPIPTAGRYRYISCRKRMLLLSLGRRNHR